MDSVMTFEERVQSRSEQLNSRLCVGLDPRPDRIEGDVYEFLLRVVDDVLDQAVVLKPNLAYFEAMGPGGYELLDQLVGEIPEEIPVLLDGKRGDIPETQKYHARAYFDRWDVDAVTLNPYTGYDSVEPFLDYEEKGVYLLGITSNPGAVDVQLPRGGDPGAFRRVLEMARRPEEENLGLVMGLTNLNRDLLVSVRDLPLLIPGLGAQGGDVQGLQDLRTGASVLVNSSRTILYGSEKSSAGSVRERAINYRERINDAFDG